MILRTEWGGGVNIQIHEERTWVGMPWDMMSGGTINAERVLAEEVDGEETFVKRTERKVRCVEMAIVFRNTMGDEWEDEFISD